VVENSTSLKEDKGKCNKNFTGVTDEVGNRTHWDWWKKYLSYT